MDYPPYTKQQENEIYRKAARFLVGFIAIKVALYMVIALLAKSVRNANPT